MAFIYLYDMECGIQNMCIGYYCFFFNPHSQWGEKVFNKNFKIKNKKKL